MENKTFGCFFVICAVLGFLSSIAMLGLIIAGIVYLTSH